MKTGWPVPRLAALVTLLMLLSCQTTPVATPPRPPDLRGVTDPLARIDLNAENIRRQSADRPPVAEAARDIRADVGHADDAFQDLIEAWGSSNHAYEVQLADLKKKLETAGSEARKKYQAFMFKVQALCALAGIFGLGACVYLPGKLRALAGAVATAGAVGFVGILVSNAIEEFMWTWGMWIAGGAISALFAVLIWALVRHIRANRELTLSSALLIDRAGGMTSGIAGVLNQVQAPATAKIVDLARAHLRRLAEAGRLPVPLPDAIGP